MAITAALVGLLAVIGTAEAAAVPARRGIFGPDPTIQAASSDLSFTYAGCYFDPVGTVLSGLNVFDTTQMTPDKCITACKSQGFDTAALATPLFSSSRCWCAPANFFNLNKGSDSSCLTPCSGASNLACGGSLTNILVYKKDIARYSAVSNAAYSTSSSLAAYSASTSSSLSAYSASTSAAGYSKTSSLNAYSASTSAAAYSSSTSAAQSSLNAYSSSTSAAQSSLNAYSSSTSAAAYSQSTASAQSSLNAYSSSTSAAAYSKSSSLNAYSASTSAAAYSQSTAAAQASLNAYSASQSAAAYSQSTAAAQASLNAYSASTSAAAYSQSTSLAGYSASVSAAGAAQSASAFSASVSAASASASAASASLSAASASAAAASASAAAATQLPSGWTKSSVCVAEGANGRALSGDFTSGNMTYSKCVNYCSSKGYKLAGVEYSQECYCGNALANGAALSKTSQNCNMACGGDSNSICGGSNAITLFTSDVSGLNADLNQVATTPVVPVPATLPNGWAVASSSCIAEGTTGRAFDSATITGNDMTIAKCLSHCSDAGFPYAGLEYAGECRCGTQLSNGASLSKTSTQCTMACSGDSTSICGGPNAISLYYNAGLAATPSAVSSAAPSPSASAPPLPAGWSVGSSSCIQEVSGRALTGVRMDDPKMTPGKCATFCSAQGFKYAGVEYATECYCGNSLVNGASTSLVSGQCNMACGGDASLTCGGPNAIQLFYNPSVVAPAPSASASSSAAPPAPTAPASINGLANRGCIQEVQGRALTGDSKASDDMTLEQCGSYCTGKGFSMFGVEYGRECYCGNQFSNGASASSLSGQCNMPCAGNSAELCGGPNAINLYSA